MSPEERRGVDRLRRRLIERAWLADDPVAYAAGVEDAIRVVEAQLDGRRPAAAGRAESGPQPR